MHGMAESCSIRTSVISDDVVGNVDKISSNIIERGALDVNRRGHG